MATHMLTTERLQNMPRTQTVTNEQSMQKE